MNTRIRDYQRSAVYAAEWTVFDCLCEPEFNTLTQCQEFAHQIMATQHWLDNKGWKVVRLHSGAGHRKAKYYKQRNGHPRSVVLPLWARTKHVMIHEFAHALTDRTEKNVSPHGTYFCGHYLALVYELLGEVCYQELKDSFDTHKVKYVCLQSEGVES